MNWRRCRYSSIVGRKLHNLDGMRGVAALMVASLHIGYDWNFAPSSFLGVDLFFLISGVVIASAYDSRIDQGLSTFDFMRIRLIRLYPMYLLGTCACLMVGLTHQAATIGIISTSLLMLPSPETSLLYPVMAVAWSLMFEVFVNLFFVIRHRMLTGAYLLTITLVALVWLITTTIRYGDMSGGAHWGSMWSGAPRVLFSFFVGVLIWRYRSRLIFELGPAIALPIIVLVCLCTPGNPKIFDLLVVVVLWPILVIGGINSRQSYPWLSILGTISYPLYCIHSVVSWQSSAAPQTPIGAVSAWLVTIVVAYLTAQYYDTPVRDWLTRRTVVVHKKAPVARR